MDVRVPPYAEFRFAFHSHDFDASLRFYQEQLGLLHIGGWDRPDGRGALLNAAFGAVIEIFGAPGGGKPERADYSAINLALRLENPAAVDAAYKRLQAARVHLEGPPKDQPWGHRVFVARDPDGIAVHLYAELQPPTADAQGVQR